MKSMKTYAEKLQDPRWQKKRLAVMAAAGWECSSCGTQEETLHVHHNAYRRNAEPWDYEAEELTCLCASCHKQVEHGKQVMNDMILMHGGLSMYLNIGRMCVDEAAYGFAEMIACFVAKTKCEWGMSMPEHPFGGEVLRLLQMEGVDASRWKVIK